MEMSYGGSLHTGMGAIASDYARFHFAVFDCCRSADYGLHLTSPGALVSSVGYPFSVPRPCNSDTFPAAWTAYPQQRNASFLRILRHGHRWFAAEEIDHVSV